LVPAEERRRHVAGVEQDAVGADAIAKARGEGIEVGEGRARVGHHRAGGDFRGGHDCPGSGRISDGEICRCRGHEQVGAQVEVGLARAENIAALDRFRAEAQVGDDRATLLGEAELVEAAHVEAGIRGRDGEHLRRGDDPRAADAHEADVDGSVGPGGRGVGQVRRRQGRRSSAGALRLARDDLDERRAVAVEAREVLVAGGLVDCGLAAELGVDRDDRETVRLGAAIAAALADALIDDDASRRRGHEATLALAPQLGRALLIVEQSRRAGDGGEVGQHLIEVVAVVDAHAVGEARLGIPARVLGRDRDLLDALGEQGPGEVGHGHTTDDVLTAGHRDRAIAKDAVGDIRPRRDARAHGEAAGVVEGAVAEILDQVLVAHEGRHTDPGTTLAAHLGEADDIADLVGVHEDDEGVAADAGGHQAVAGGAGRAVVRAAGAEVWRARCRRGQ
jgi:hypothetical protein